MNAKRLCLMLFAAALSAPVSATTTANVLQTGTYMATLSPSVDAKTGMKIQNQVGMIPSVESAQVDPANSSLRFTVKPNSQVDAKQIAKAVDQTAPGTMLGEASLVTTTSGASGAIVSTSSNTEMRQPANGKY